MNLASIRMKSAIPKSSAILGRPRVYIRDKKHDIAIGPGKIELLREVDKTRSITAAARVLEIPYKQAWLLLDELNRGFGRPVVETATGGKGGGGTSLTPLGQQLVARYDALEKQLNTKALAALTAIRSLAD